MPVVSSFRRDNKSLYLSPVQWARLFGIAWLDEDLRKDPTHGSAYQDFMRENLRILKHLFFPEDLGNEMVPLYHPEIFRVLQNEKWVHLDSLRRLDPSLPMGEALEVDCKTGADNGIVYLMGILFYLDHHKDRRPKGVDEGPLCTRENLSRMAGNLSYLRLVQIDPVPSALDGYEASLIHDIASGEKTAMALPTAATCS